MKYNVTTLRDYQLDIKIRIQAEWEKHKNVMVQMPTGTGKTHVLAAVVLDYLQKGNSGCVWIIAHRRELVAQIEETVERYGIRTEDGNVRAMSIQWLIRHLDDADGTPGLIVIDEAHHVLAESYQALWRRYPEAYKLGMTATPCRLNKRGFADLFDTLITSWSIPEFISRGYLSVFDYVSICANSEEQRLIEKLSKRGADGDYQVKEMNGVLNRLPSIERLFLSMDKFARGKKGIVYAICIEHARRIAEYYSLRGVDAVAIDSKTPAAERKLLVEEFKEGKVDVLVNVDVFSEGFDCPDVEFIQMARPTLSLSKYLQQVGRGLRQAEGKEACVLIDNVGLYRVFGLPTVSWDWDAMFSGVVAGKGSNALRAGNTACLSKLPQEDWRQDNGMELVVSHDKLLDFIEKQKSDSSSLPVRKMPDLKIWQDANSGLWGLRLGQRRITDAELTTVFDIRYGMVAVRFRDKRCGIISSSGEVAWKQDKYQSMKFGRNYMAVVTLLSGKDCYVDLYNFRIYEKRPEVKKIGNVELLKVGRVYYSRTKTVYACGRRVDGRCISDQGFFLVIFDDDMPFLSDKYDVAWNADCCGAVCLLEGDHDSFYRMHSWLSDDSIVVMGEDRRFFHVEKGKQKRYIGCTESPSEEKKCKAEIERLKACAREKKAGQRVVVEENRLHLQKQFRYAVPFQVGMKWGLKVGERITVPPIYRNVRPPVGEYCVVEMNYSQWGVIAVDGKMLIEPKYQDITIDADGVAVLTFVTGKKVSVKLQ